MGKVEDRSGAPVPTRVRMLESDTERNERALLEARTEWRAGHEDLRREIALGRTQNNKLLISILLTLIAVLLAAVVAIGQAGILGK